MLYFSFFIFILTFSHLLFPVFLPCFLTPFLPPNIFIPFSYFFLPSFPVWFFILPFFPSLFFSYFFIFIFFTFPLLSYCTYFPHLYHFLSSSRPSILPSFVPFPFIIVDFLISVSFSANSMMYLLEKNPINSTNYLKTRSAQPAPG